jgi:hypothetical protein
MHTAKIADIEEKVSITLDEYGNLLRSVDFYFILLFFTHAETPPMLRFVL